LLLRGYTYVDVRSELEFSHGHPPGAFNVPLMHVEDDRLVDNPRFLSVMLSAFRTTDPLIVGCHSGARSHTAVQRLEHAGFSALAELQHGFSGARDAFGRRLPGWLARGLPVETEAAPERTYAALAVAWGWGPTAPDSQQRPSGEG
jgi:rhodanese-related sulfurtransferase